MIQEWKWHLTNWTKPWTLGRLLNSFNFNFFDCRFLRLSLFSLERGTSFCQWIIIFATWSRHLIRMNTMKTLGPNSVKIRIHLQFQIQSDHQNFTFVLIFKFHLETWIWSGVACAFSPKKFRSQFSSDWEPKLTKQNKTSWKRKLWISATWRRPTLVQGFPKKSRHWSTNMSKVAICSKSATPVHSKTSHVVTSWSHEWLIEDFCRREEPTGSS